MIKKNDFVEVEYTGTIKETGEIFDTTSKEIAQKNDIFSDKMKYGPVVVCIGEAQLVKGLDEEMIGKKTDEEYTIELPVEKAFGKKDGKLLKIIKTSVFTRQNIQPVPGLQINIDGVVGTIRSVSGGRTIVDFNHPLASKEIIYKVKVKKIVTDIKEKLKSYFNLQLGIKEPDLRIEGSKVFVKVFNPVPDEVKKELVKKINELIPEIKEMEFLLEKKKDTKQ